MNKNVIIGISGYRKAGKTTLASQLTEVFYGRGHSVTRTSFAAPLHRDFEDLTGFSWQEGKNLDEDAARDLLAALSHFQRQKRGEWFLREKVFKQIRASFDQDGDAANDDTWRAVIIDDVRTTAEYDMLDGIQGATFISILKSRKEQDTRTHMWNSPIPDRLPHCEISEDVTSDQLGFFGRLIDTLPSSTHLQNEIRGAFPESVDN